MYLTTYYFKKSINGNKTNVLKKVRQIEIKRHEKSNNILRQYHSAFKGMSFSVREFSCDDIRDIWNDGTIQQTLCEGV